jgi:hypothetical protein
MLDSIRALRVPVLPRDVGLQSWVREHDERWSFVLLYLGLAVGLSVFVSLFWLLVVAALHFLVECWRQSFHRSSAGEVVAHALWEIKLDVGLVLLALTLVLYMDVVLGLLGLQSAARAAAVGRAGARIGARAAAWERNVRTFLLTIDEIVRIGYAGYLVRRGRTGVAGSASRPADAAAAAEAAAAAAATEAAAAAAAAARAAEPAPAGPGAGWRGRWGIADRIGVVLVAAGMLLLLAAPFITPHDFASAAEALRLELRPFGAD